MGRHSGHLARRIFVAGGLGVWLATMSFGCGDKTTAQPVGSTPSAPATAPGPAAATTTPTPGAEPKINTPTAPVTLPLPSVAPAAPRVSPPLTAVPADAAHFPARRYRRTVTAAPAPAGFKPSPAVECYGNYETMGVIATLPAGLQVADIARIRCYLNVNGQWQAQQDLVQVGATSHFATSIFGLEEGFPYQVKVEVLNAAGAVTQTWHGEGKTRQFPASNVQENGRSMTVAPEGDDRNDGSKQRPFKTLAHALQAAQNIDRIDLQGGVYYEGDLKIPAGQAGAGLQITGQQGVPVVIDGSKPELADAGVWKKEADGLYSHAYDGKCQCVVLEDKKTGALTRLLPIFTVDELRTRTVAKQGGFAGSTFAKEGITGAFTTDGKTAWLLPPGPLEQYSVHIAQATKAFILENSGHVQFSNLTVRYFGKEDYAAAALIYNSSNVIFENCHFLFNDVGIWVKGNSNNVTVQNCTFLDGVKDFPFGMQKVGGCPLSFEAGVVNVDAKWSGRGLVVRGNHIENQFDGVHLTSWKENTAVTNEIDFYNNTVLDCVDDFIEADGFARNVRIFDNYMRRSLSGVSLAQALDGPTYVCYNVIADCGRVPATTREGNGGYPFKTNGGDGANIGSGEIFFYHNTAYTTDPESRAMWVKRPNWKKITFRNNIWYGKKLGFDCWKNPPSPVDFDYDNLFCANPAAALVVLNYKTSIADLVAVRAQLKWLEHGISADPKIIDEEKGVYTLQAGSPCIDAGVAVPGINDGRSAGKAPDLGAFESEVGNQ